MRDHREGSDPTIKIPIDPAIFRRLELGEERRRRRGYVRGTTPKADPVRKARRQQAKLSRRRNR